MRTVSSRAVRGLVRGAGAVLAVLLVLTADPAFAANPSGIDTSNHQHGTSLNWASVKAGGVTFAFLKATEGSTFSDPYFSADWSATGRVGIYHGAYHFARPSIGSARAQARFFVAKIGPQKARGTLPPVLDLEATGGLTPSQLVTWTHTWLSTVQQLTGRDPIIYVSPYFWKTNLANNAGFHDYPLWVANYGVSSPMVPGGWPTWSFWQTSSSGRISGISGYVDKDVFNGSMTQLQKFALAYDPSPTTLTLSASNAAPMSGQSVTFSGTLQDAAGKPVAGKTIALAVQAPGSTTWTSVGTATTTSTGAYSRKVVVLAPGRYRATFGGDADYRSATSPVASITLTPIPTTASLSATADQALAGTGVTFSGALAASAGQPLAGRSVTVSRQVAGSTTWQVLARRTTDSAGAFTVTATMLKSAAYRVDYAGDVAYAAAASPTASVTVTLNPTALVFHVSNAAPYANQPVLMYGKLLNGTNLVTGRSITLERQTTGSTTWTPVASLTTDSTGHFQAAPRVDGPAAYRAVFAGDPIYAASTAEPVSLTITPPARTRLTLGAPLSPTQRLPRGRTTVLSGELTTTSGEPVVGHVVGVWKRLAGTSRWYRVARVATLTPSGRWQVTVRPSRSCWFKAVFAGGTRLTPARSVAVRINVG